mgnify:CR=1 FL=1
MSVQSRSFPISFMVTTEVPCPYLPDRMERKIITELSGGQATELFELLSRAGFRRSHSIAYRPACAGCHGPSGTGIPSQYPRIAGQHADYAVAQLLAFRDGVRLNNAQMTGVTAKMNDREIKAVSDYIAGLR